MEVVYLRGSPWSIPLVWSIYKSGNDHSVQKWTEHTPIFGDLYLRWKMGSSASGKTLTVPVVFDNEGRLRADSSLTAAKLLCSPNIYPAEQEKDLELWNSKCDKVRRLVRGIGIQANDNLAEILFGRIPVITSLLSYLSTFWIKSKYSEGDLSISNDEGAAILLEMTEVVKERPYFLNTTSPTYVDFAIAVLLETILPEYGCTISSLAAKGAKATKEVLILPNSAALEPLLSWKRKLFEDHFLSPDLYAMRKRLELPGLELGNIKPKL